MLLAIPLMRADLDDANWLGTRRNRIPLVLLAAFLVLLVAAPANADESVRTIVSIFGLACTLLEGIWQKLRAPEGEGAVTRALKIEQFCRRCGAENIRFARGDEPAPSCVVNQPTAGAAPQLTRCP